MTYSLCEVLNEDEVKRHLEKNEKFFGPTDKWDNERSWDRIWSFRGKNGLKKGV